MNKEHFMLWLRAAAVRAIRTFAQAVGSYLTVAVTISDVNWGVAFGAGAIAAVYSILMSLAGLPEVELEAEAKYNQEGKSDDSQNEIE